MPPTSPESTANKVDRDVPVALAMDKSPMGTSGSTSQNKAERDEPVAVATESSPKGTSSSTRAKGNLVAVIDGPRSVRFESRSLPEPGPGQVRVRLEGCGVCGSNLPVWEGRPWFKYPLNAGAPGHEGWGRIDAVGPGVDGLHEGDRVAVLSYQAYAQYDLADAASVVPLPATLDDQPFPGEALGCAMNVFRRADIHVGQNVAIVGVGFLGALLTSLVARHGARVIAITRRQSALELAKRMGASDLVPMDDHQKIIGTVMALTDGKGCERVIEATGLQWPLDIATELTAERGKLIVAGYHQDGPRQVNMQLWNWRGIDVVNAHERDPALYVRGMSEAVEAVASGRLDPQPLYTHRFKLDQLSDALDSMRERNGDFLKALVTYE